MQVAHPLSIRRLLAGGLLALTLGVLAGCGGGGGGGGTGEQDPGVAGDPYFPLLANARWRHLEDGALVDTTVSGTASINGETALVLSTVGSPGEDSYFVKSATGVSVVAGPNSDAITRAVGRYDVARFPLRVGSSFVALDRSVGALFDMDGDGRLDQATLRIDVKVVGFERVSTPVGAFDNALRMRTVYTYTFSLSAAGRTSTFVTNADEWYAADVGPVRSSYVSTYDGAAAGQGESELRVYRVGTRRGADNSPPPAVVAVQPTSTDPVGPGAELTLRFSEAMDPATVNGGALVVRGVDGSALGGAITWDDERTLRFRPAAALAHGQHSVSLARGTADWFGRTVATDTASNFQVDARGPAIAAQTPAPDSLGRIAQITVRFDEPTQQTQVQPPSLVVTGPGGSAVVGSVRWQDDRTLAFTSNGPLASGAYAVNLGAGAVDRLGNASTVGAQWNFTIDATGPTLVALSPLNDAVEVPIGAEIRATFDEPIAPASIDSTAAGLYRNGQAVAAAVRVDGNAVVITPQAPLLKGVTYEARFAAGLTDTVGNPLLQTATTRFVSDTGRFALPEPVAALAQEPALTQVLALADLDGNQTPDLVVAGDSALSPGMGGRLLVVPRNVDGTLASAARVIPSLGCYVYAAAVGDLDADGRNDVAAAQYFCGVEWMKQNANGSFVRQGVLAATSAGQYLQTIALAGNTRPGLVYTDGITLKLLRPAAAGGFEAAETVQIGGAEMGRMVVADINGDGRADIVATGRVGLNPGLILARQNADATFTVETRVVATATQVIAVGDVDGDGRADVLVGDNASGPALNILRQTAGGTLAAPTALALPLAPVNIRVVDFNGDGLTDIVVSHASADFASVSFSVATQTAGGGFDVGNPFDFSDPVLINSALAFVVADFTGDGLPDILIGTKLIRKKPTAAGPAATTLPHKQRQRAAGAAGTWGQRTGLGR